MAIRIVYVDLLFHVLSTFVSKVLANIVSVSY